MWSVEFSYHPKPEPAFDCAISPENVKFIFSNCDDFFLREIRLGLDGELAVSACWIDGVVSEAEVSEDVLRPLADDDRLREIPTARGAAELIRHGAVYRGTIHARETMDELVSDLTLGHAALIFDELALALTFEVKSTQGRAVSEASIERQ